MSLLCRSVMSEAIRRFFRTPKGLLILLLLPLLGAACLRESPSRLAVLVGAALIGALAIDLPVLRWRTGAWTVPDGAILTAMIVAMVLSPQTSWRAGVLTAALGVASKYLARVRGTHVFNPAAVALVAAFYLFDSAQSWWGALPDLPLPWIALPAVLGLFITRRVNKLPAAIAFLGVYYALALAMAWAGNAAQVAELYRAPDVHAALYFAFFMVTDPPTSPPKAREQVVFGGITGAVSWGIFAAVGAVWWLPGGLLVANAWEAWRRARARAERSRRT